MAGITGTCNATQMMVLVLFLAGVGVPFFSYVGYPLLLWSVSRVWGRETPPPLIAEDALPSVTLVIAACDEEAVITARLENALSADYPADRFQVVVVSDGSRDRTEALVRSHPDRRVSLVSFPVRRGKAAVLAEVLPRVDSDVVVLSDANTMMAADAVRRLARWFTRTDVGVVCGHVRLVDTPGGTNTDGVYWRLENWLKRHEARLGATLGANGALYALRPSDAHYLPPSAIVEDFVLPLRILIGRTAAVLYDPTAKAEELTPSSVDTEFRRRVRIGRGDAQALGLLWRLMHPRHGWTAAAFIGHKVLRWISPFALAAAAAANLALPLTGIFGATMAVQVVAAGAAGLLLLVPKGGAMLPRGLRLAGLFYVVNAAIMVGFLQWYAGYRPAIWDRTARA